jgi:hypothetical protein
MEAGLFAKIMEQSGKCETTDGQVVGDNFAILYIYTRKMAKMLFNTRLYFLGANGSGFLLTTGDCYHIGDMRARRRGLSMELPL